MQKHVKDIVVGDIITTESCERVKVTSVSHGMLRGHVMFHWQGGWGSAHRNDLIECEPVPETADA